MFSSLLQFLPPALSPGDRTPLAPEPQPPHADENTTMDKVAEETQKRKRERTSESFIVVRPPPSKTNHPLNLQVQLVPPSSRDPVRPSSSGSTHSIDSTASGDLTLSRTASNRSDTSAYSGYSSTTSFSSSASSASGRRMIIPLYNLQAHNVMQNVIVDAGTDAKVAKFMKRGLEIIGLAVLEPVEVWGPPGSLDVWVRTPAPAPMQEQQQQQWSRQSGDFAPSMASSLLSAEPPQTAASSAFSLQSDEPPEPPATPSTPSTPRGKLFGRLFKRRTDSAPNSAAPPPSSRPSSAFVSPPSPGAPRPLAKRGSLHLHAPSGSTGEERGAILQPPVLGIQPVLSSASVPPRGRPTQYVWIVRRWLKGGQEGVLGGVKDLLPERERDRDRRAPGLEAMVEVRFEWTRGKSTRKRRRGTREGEGEASRERGRAGGTGSKRSSVARSDTASSGEMGAASAQSHQSQSQSQRQPPHSPSSPTMAHGNNVRKQRSTLSPGGGGRRSMDSHRSASPHPPASILTNTTEMDDPEQADGDEDDGEESDPEDSETPWTCILVVRRLPGHAHGSSVGGTPGGREKEREKPIRLMVARVTPTPHHPKVVALLKILFPLPDVEVDRVHLRKRIVTPAGVARPAPPSSGKDGNRPGTAMGSSGGKGFWQQPREDLVLTAEEIKDVVSSTGLWLVVREGFGGVGRVSRKGDGWKLRG